MNLEQVINEARDKWDNILYEDIIFTKITKMCFNRYTQYKILHNRFSK